MNDYEIIARIIRYLDKEQIRKPDIKTLADKVGLRPVHFRRLFTKWAEITPENFLQSLTLSYANNLLKESEGGFDVPAAKEFSGSYCLHNLCINLNSVSLGELKTEGKEWVLSVGFSESPFGRCFLAKGPRGIIHISFVEIGNDNTALEMIQKDWPLSFINRDDAIVRQIASRIFNPLSHAPSSVPLKAYIRGTAFQVSVWRALLQVKFGTLVSYGQLAKIIGQPTALRAVGAAVGQNALAYLIPCHRVVPKTGIIGNYRWGKIRKRVMVAWESSAYFTPKGNDSERINKLIC